MIACGYVGIGAPVASSFWRAVGVQLPHADGEELHHLACVVFVGIDGAVGLVVVHHVEVVAHHRRERHLGQQVLEIAERVVHSICWYARHAVGHVHDDPDVTKICESAKATRWRNWSGPRERIAEERVLQQEQRVVVALAVRVGAGGAEGGLRPAARRRTTDTATARPRTARQPTLDADRLHMRDQRIRGPERRLLRAAAAASALLHEDGRGGMRTPSSRRTPAIMDTRISVH